MNLLLVNNPIIHTWGNHGELNCAEVGHGAGLEVGDLGAPASLPANDSDI